jgi:hypothetical protein
MRLLHYSAAPFRLDQRVVPQGSEQMKPSGLWVSIEDGPDPWGWADWCRSEGFDVERLAHVQEVTLDADANVLMITNLAEFDAFNREWQASRQRQPGLDYYVDWRGVAARWQGIIIAPYQWARRYGPLWYYIWDCASGCIWDTSAVAEVSPVAG